ncbi:hypothetical protein GCM10027446_25300 [Angustibacter peucedani]
MSEPEPGELPPGGEAVELDDLDWDAWRPSFVAERLGGVRTPWYVAGGWALDLFRGEQTREHEDLEIACPAAGFAEIAGRFDEVDWYVVGAGHRWPVSPVSLAFTHQTWACERGSGTYRLDVFREPHDGEQWICRRDASIRRPYVELVRRTASGVPYLRPEVVLLFKAKAVREKDQRDLDGALPLLDDGACGWLRWALGRAHPGHPWLARV